MFFIRVWPTPGVTANHVEDVLDAEADWIRFDTMSWLVRSNRNANQLSRRLRNGLGQDIRHVVIRVQRNDAQGSMAGNFWEWLNEGPP